MALLKTEEVFRFCAIPQVMAIATLAELYNNPKVFTGVVKIRKCQAAKLILDTKSVGGLHKWFNVLTRSILRRVPQNDPNAEKTIEICNKVIRLTDGEATREIAGNYAQVGNVIASSVLALSTYKVFSEGDKAGKTLSLLSGGSFSVAALKKIVLAPVSSTSSSLLTSSGWVSAFGLSLFSYLAILLWLVDAKNCKKLISNRVLPFV